jgi:hypothetical protein
MKRNLKRKPLSHERTKGSVDHGTGAAAKLAADVPEREKEDCPGYCSQMEREASAAKQASLSSNVEPDAS